jgi:hypothetical protein
MTLARVLKRSKQGVEYWQYLPDSPCDRLLVRSSGTDMPLEQHCGLLAWLKDCHVLCDDGLIISIENVRKQGRLFRWSLSL